MNSTWKVLVLALLSVVASAKLDPRLDRHWEMWKTKYEKKYLNKLEEVNRRALWEKNLLYINIHNLEASLDQHSFTLAMNHMGDLTKEEAMQIYANLRIPKDFKRTSSPLKATETDLPDSVDWRKQGWVTPVKNQGMCGSCWAFSVVGAMEGHYFNVTEKLVNLSVQQLIDCAGDGNFGCEGGFMDQAFKYIIDHGLEDEDHYPYEGIDGVCRYNPEYRIANCSEFNYVEEGSEAALKEAVASVGPISVGVYAEPFVFYSSGIFSSKDCGDGQIDHAVLAVGYGRDGGEDFWLVKNSWGTDWGEEGYIRLARNQDNMCSIASFATYCAK